MIELPDCKVSFDMVVKGEDYVRWCNAFDLTPSEDGFKDYAQQSFLNTVKYNHHKLKIEEL